MVEAEKRTILLRRLLRPLANLLPEGMPVPILAGPLKGKKWIVGAAAGGGKGLSVVMNQSEAAQVACARRMISPGDVCFDIGANVGLYTLLFSTCAQSVYAFEPLPRNLDYLRRLIAINRMGNARVMPWAMSDAGGKGYFKLGRDHSQGRLDVDGEIQVPIRTCDQFASDRGVVPDLIKIDVEGSELKVLHGARNLLQSYHPAILLSVHSDRLRRQCLAFLADLQYETAIPIDSNLEREATEFAILRKGSACSSGCRHQHSGEGGGHRS